jgi:hypothetical protein
MKSTSSPKNGFSVCFGVVLSAVSGRRSAGGRAQLESAALEARQDLAGERTAHRVA